MRRLTVSPARSLLVIALVVVVTGCTAPGDPSRPSAGPTSGAAPSPARPAGTGRSEVVDPRPGSRAGARVARLLRRVSVVAEAPYHSGYDRSCAPGRACVFGLPWTDDHPGPFGGNGCDTRQDVLLQQLRDIELRWGSRCRVYDARLIDPYVGETLTWREDGYWIQIDHVYPLAAAWHAGAWAWPAGRRLRFANDVRRELLAVSAAVNQDKGAQTPAAWLPRPAYRCAYATRYLTVALAYDLPVTAADASVLRRVARRC